MSKLRCSASSFDSGTSRSESRNTATPTGTLMKKIHGHENACVNAPPSTRPMALPPIAIAAQTPSAFARSEPSLNVVEMIASAAGEMNAAPRPWRLRAPISIPELDERPSSSEAAVKVTRAAAEQQETAEDERVGVHDPLEVRLGHVQVDLDRGERDVHDGRV